MAHPNRRLPELSWRWIAVWRRNLRVWRKLLVPSVIGNFGEPLLYLFLFGYGLGRLLGEVERMPYMVFLASGIVCSSVMFTASFEALYSAFTRMQQQQTWSAMLNAPLNVDDIVLGEILWAATKGSFSGLAILLIATVSGLVGGWQALLVLPLIALIGACFGALAMVVTAVSPSYDFFLYFFTLVLTPMLLLSGVFFPPTELPAWVADAAFALPLAHAVAVVRPLMVGGWPDAAAVAVHLGVILLYTAVCIVIATRVLRRRLAD